LRGACWTAATNRGFPRCSANPGEHPCPTFCYGAKALIFNSISSPRAPKLKTRETYEQKDLPTHELGTDAPGRVTNSVGGARSAVSQTDWHDWAEREFLNTLAERLDTAVTAGDAKSLVIVTPPRALGTLRDAYTPHVHEAIRAEIDKDLVKLPLPEIEKHLA
jgi:protein required for attachment to host cells